MDITSMAIEDHIRMAIEAEGERAAKIHGSVFNSPHEAWAVLVEEMEEVRDESERLTNGMDDLWHMVRHDQDPELLLVRMKVIVKRFIQESIQVAAVIDKYSRTNDLFNRSKEEKK